MISAQGIARSCRYSFPTNKKDYCGPHNAFSFFSEFQKNPSVQGAEKAKSLVRGFPILFSYYDFISREAGLDPFDQKVIDYYWHGTGLVDFSPQKAREFVLEVLPSVGLSPERAQKISEKISRKTRLDHAFHVLRVKFVTDKVEKKVENFSNCVVLPAKVTGMADGKILAESVRLADLSGNFDLIEKVLENPFSLEPKEGGFVSVHWNTAIEKISKAQAGLLKKRVLGCLK